MHSGENVYFSPLIIKNSNMKIKQFLTGLLLVATVCLTACKSKPKDIIVQKWKLTDVSGIPDSEKNNFLKGADLEFTKDGKYHSVVSGKEENGTYKLSDDGKSLSMIPSSNPEGIINVIELTKDKFVGEKNNIIITCTPK